MHCAMIQTGFFSGWGRFWSIPALELVLGILQEKSRPPCNYDWPRLNARTAERRLNFVIEKTPTLLLLSVMISTLCPIPSERHGASVQFAGVALVRMIKCSRTGSLTLCIPSAMVRSISLFFTVIISLRPRAHSKKAVCESSRCSHNISLNMAL